MSQPDDPYESWTRGSPTLRRVIAAAATTLLTGGRRVTIASVELWSDHTVWHFAISPALPAGADADWTYRQIDAQGTDFAVTSISRSRGDRADRGQVVFEPAVPLDHGVISLAVEGLGDFVVDISAPKEPESDRPKT